MKILLIHNRYLHPGGEDEVVQSEQKLLRAFGHQTVLYQRDNDEVRKFSFFKKIYFFCKEICWSEDTYRELRELIRQEQPDIAHVHNTFSVLSPSVYQACRDEHVPVVQTLHNYRFLCPIGLFYRKGKVCEDCLTSGRKAAVIHGCWKKSRLLSLILVRVVQQFYRRDIFKKMIAEFIVLSDFSRKKYQDSGWASENISVKPNFLDFDPGLGAKRGNYALFVGGLFDYKGITTLLAAWEKMKAGCPLKVIGGGPLANELRASCKSPDVEFLGRKPLKETISFIQQARLVVVPSECYENFPRTIVEAYACGVPVLASRIGALAELVKDQETGLLFEPRQADDLARQAQRLFDDEAGCTAMGQRARRLYEENYTADKNYERLMHVYQKACSR